jgi:hypothetical protein
MGQFFVAGIVEVWVEGTTWKSVDFQLDPLLWSRLNVEWKPDSVPRTLESRGFVTGSRLDRAK